MDPAENDTPASDTIHLEMTDFQNSVTIRTCCSSEKRKCPKPTTFFNDGIRSVDFILVWHTSSTDPDSPEASAKRQIFEKNLLAEELELEYEPHQTDGYNFIKIHAPTKVLKRYSEILKLRMPMKKISVSSRISRYTQLLSDSKLWQNLKMFFADKKTLPERAHRLTAVYSRDKEYLFDSESQCFFLPSIHSTIVHFILERTRFIDDLNEDFGFGIEGLLNDEVYDSTYPVHDGGLETNGSIRNLLKTEWASIRKFYRCQPLDYVKEYFGVKVALYFAWLGFYTYMLLPPAIVGLVCFIYSLWTMNSNEISDEICNLNLTEKMCPLCDEWCGYWDLKETCDKSRITYLFDNPSTVFFAVFMSLWATTFLEMWKRYSAEITHHWNLTGFDVQEEQPRPQYLARVGKLGHKSVNFVTNATEPYVPFWTLKLPMSIVSFSVVVLLVCMALAAVVAVVLYRMSVLVAFKVTTNKVDTSSAILFTSITAASINLITIIIFNKIYAFVAEYITEREYIRTQTEYDDSLTLKIYLLQFVNYYASIFYIAFFKGKFVGYPKGYNRIFGYRQEECGPGGCLLELCIQLSVIMVGKQALNAAMEMILPQLLKWVKKWKKSPLEENLSEKEARPQWVEDFDLVDGGPRSLFPEYLEMVLQYGFVTIFVAAFPLAPFFALLNNIFELRLDAKKLLIFYRRPVSQRVRDIGVWYSILDAIGKLSVITNGFIIAFTSDFIPRLVYRISISPNGTLTGYLSNSLSQFRTADYEILPLVKDGSNVDVCRYPDYREPHTSPDKYEVTSLYWHILAARLIFVLLFEHLIMLFMTIVEYCIPDIPEDLRHRIKREAYITNEMIIKQESQRANNKTIYEEEIDIEKRTSPSEL